MFNKKLTTDQSSAFAILNDWWDGKETAYLLDDLYNQEFGWQEQPEPEEDHEGDFDDGRDRWHTGPNHHDPVARVHYGDFGCGGDSHI